MFDVPVVAKENFDICMHYFHLTILASKRVIML